MTALSSLTSCIKDILDKFINITELEPGKILVVGCSTSEILGEKIGSASNTDVAQAVMLGLLAVTQKNGIYLAIQCCEHLNRSLVVEHDCAVKYNLETVSVFPCIKAGGALSVVAMEEFTKPVIVESILAHAGLDIGSTLIGMHLKKVAVPVRMPIKMIGHAHLILAVTRPKYIGGERAKYKPELAN